MPNLSTSYAIRNSVTGAAILIGLSTFSPNSAEAAPLQPRYESLPQHSPWTAVPEEELANLSKLTTHLSAKKIRASAVELTPLGIKLLKLRSAAIAAGMKTLSGEEILEEYRAAREV